jgi:hypothetical protein
VPPKATRGTCWISRLQSPAYDPVRGHGLSFARSLGRRGVQELLLETKPQLGVYTRFAQYRPSDFVDAAIAVVEGEYDGLGRQGQAEPQALGQLRRQSRNLVRPSSERIGRAHAHLVKSLFAKVQALR